MWVGLRKSNCGLRFSRWARPVRKVRPLTLGKRGGGLESTCVHSAGERAIGGYRGVLGGELDYVHVHRTEPRRVHLNLYFGGWGDWGVKKSASQ